MRRRLKRSTAMLLLAVFFAAGCSDGTDSAPTASVKKYERSELPKTTQELPPLDQGRVEIPTPKDWQWRSQEKGILARFHLKGRSGIPQIIIKLDGDAASEISDVTPENVQQYADGLQAQLDKQGTKYIEPARPLILGKNAFARYVMAGKLPNKQTATLERQILKTTRGGRTYTVELQVPVKELLKYRDPAYAIAAGMVFLSPDAAADDSKPAEDTPAPETKPSSEPADNAK